MIKTVAGVICGVLLLFLAARDASAQLIPWEERGFLNLSGAGQSGSASTARRFEFVQYDEPASIDLKRDIKGGGLFDLTVGARVYKNWAGAIDFFKRSHNSDASVRGSIPDPIVSDSFRSVTTTLPSLKHHERWIGVLAGYMLPATDKIDVLLLAGPIAVSVDHEVAQSATVSESQSGPQLNFTRQTLSKTVWGFQAGADVRYMVTKMFGGGAFVRFSTASATLADDLKLDLGGVQAGIGLRVRF